jgi:Rnl2 family RNA ligase
MDTFQGYEKISASTRDWLLGEDDHRRLGRCAWVVTEKIHGANFCFLLEAGQIRCAKRKALLEPSEAFFNHHVVLERLRPALLRLWGLLTQNNPGLVRAWVFGELFGGAYPHPEVTPLPQVQAIQTGVWYSPRVEFMGFDLAIAQEGDDPEGPRRYLPWAQARELAQSSELPWCQALLEGSLSQAQAYPVGFDSTIPALLGLPPLPAGQNKAEGIVLKPTEPLLIQTRRGLMRPVLKIKIPGFAEDKRFYQSVPWSVPAPCRGDQDLELLSWEISCRLEPNRLAAAASKLGRPRHLAQVGPLRDLVLQDVWEEVQEGFGLPWSRLGPQDRELLWELARDEATELVQSALSPG